MDNAHGERLSELSGGSIVVRKDDTPEEFGQANISILFSDGAMLGACYWRMIGSDGTVLSSFDHQQRYGLPEPVDAKKLLAEFLNDQTVLEAEIDRKTGDLQFSFSSGTNLQVFGFSAYEVWELRLPDGAIEYSNHL